MVIRYIIVLRLRSMASNEYNTQRACTYTKFVEIYGYIQLMRNMYQIWVNSHVQLSHYNQWMW